MAIDTTILTELSDIVGEPICVGDIITYPVRHGSTLWMSISVVRGVDYVESRWTREPDAILVVDVIQGDGAMRRAKVERTDRVVKLHCTLEQAIKAAEW